MADLSQAELDEMLEAHYQWFYLRGGTRLDLTGRSLRGLELDGRDFAGAELAENDFSECDLTGADLSRAILIGADLRLLGWRTRTCPRQIRPRLTSVARTSRSSPDPYRPVRCRAGRSSAGPSADEQERLLAHRPANAKLGGATIDRSGFEQDRIGGADFTGSTGSVLADSMVIPYEGGVATDAVQALNARGAGVDSFTPTDRATQDTDENRGGVGD